MSEAKEQQYGGNTKAEWMAMARRYPQYFIERAGVSLSGVTEPWVEESYEIALPQVPADGFRLAHTFAWRGNRMIAALKKAANTYAGAGPALEYFRNYGLFGEVDKTCRSEGTEIIRGDITANQMPTEHVEAAVEGGNAFGRGQMLDGARGIEDETTRAAEIAAINNRDWTALTADQIKNQGTINSRAVQIFPWAMEIAKIAAAKVPHLVQESPELVDALPEAVTREVRGSATAKNEPHVRGVLRARSEGCLLATRNK